MENRDIKNVAVRVPMEIYRPAKVRLAATDSSLQDLVVSLLVEWLQESQDDDTHKSGDFPQNTDKGIALHSEKDHTIGTFDLSKVVAHLGKIPESARPAALALLEQTIGSLVEFFQAQGTKPSERKPETQVDRDARMRAEFEAIKAKREGDTQRAKQLAGDDPRPDKAAPAKRVSGGKGNK